VNSPQDIEPTPVNSPQDVEPVSPLLSDSSAPPSDTALTPVAPRPVLKPPPPPRRELSSARRLMNVVREALLTVALVVVVFFASRQVVQNVEVQGHSMDTTLETNELILVDTLSYKLHPPRRGDIIILHPPVAAVTDGNSEDYVKRVIGLPGDTVQVRHGTVYINGKALSEPYLTQSHTYNWPLEGAGGAQTVPPGKLFVLGDNRDISFDSHEWRTLTGAPAPWLAEDRVIGRAMIAYWPLKDFHLFSAPIFSTIVMN